MFSAETWGKEVGVILAGFFKVSPELTQHFADCRVGKAPFGKIIEW